MTIAALVAAVAISIPAIGAHTWLHSGAAEHVYPLSKVPAKPVVMVLGAGVQPDGTPLPYLRARLALAKKLYESGTVKAILVSGDNGQVEYNEVDPMRAWLTERDVPGKQVVADYAGFDTYDSCVRAHEVFGVDAMIVVTQSFHIERAVSVCRQSGVDTVGVGDDSVRRYPVAWRESVFREYGAGIKAVWDVQSGRAPKYLGKHETGIDEALATD